MPGTQRCSSAAALMAEASSCAAIDVSSGRTVPSTRPSTSTLAMRSVRRPIVRPTCSRWAWSGSALVAVLRSSGPRGPSWKRTSAAVAAQPRTQPLAGACSAARNRWRCTAKLRSKQAVMRSSLVSLWW